MQHFYVLISDTNTIISLNPAGDPLFLLNHSKGFERNTVQNILVSVSILSKADLERYANTSFVQSVNTKFRC
jgi:hypothetical protein